MKKAKNNQNHIVHFIDSIYFGSLNTSYQKDGFGIQQTNDFQTYLGNWKNNKADGIGMIIYPSGLVIYGYFSKDLPEGITIFDNKKTIRLGVVKNTEIVGIGYEYNYSTKVWRMNKYHKGVPIEQIKEELCDLQTGIPKMLNVEQSLFFHLYNYTEKKYFHEENMHFFQFLQRNKQVGFHEIEMFGPGLKMVDDQIVEAGFYENGFLEGYGFKVAENAYEYGCYHKGKKHGVFYQNNKGNVTYNEYKKGNIEKNLNFSLHQLRTILVKVENKQKGFNFNCKDFLSAKNTIPFQICQEIMSASESRAKKQLKQTTNHPLSPKSSQKSSIKTMKLTSPLQKYKKQAEYIITAPKNKSSVQIMREKINSYHAVMSGKQIVRKRSLSKDKRMQDDEVEIAQEENPFNSGQ